MDALAALLQRVSVPQLTGPDVTPQQLDTLIQAALRAPDHARLRPSRYLAISGEQRNRFGELLLQAQPDAANLTDIKRDKILNMGLRAPLVLVAVCKVQPHNKVPREEQLLSTGAGVQNLLNAAWALGLGAIWRSGELAYNRQVCAGLGLADDEEIVGFIYVGHVNCKLKQPPVLATEDFLSHWAGEDDQ